jgi:hypothetical protein
VEELQVPTRRIRVEIFVSTGARLVGALFLHGSPYCAGHAEDLIQELHDERSFLPLAEEAAPGGSLVVNKDHILRLHVPWNESLRREQFPPGRAEAEATALRLADGSSFEGRLVFVTPQNASRLVDKLNLAPSFVLFASAEGLDFVRRSHIVHAS